jgi:3'-phosphoadenosine 5'-phosphosulfate sulfotransferase (PAPS reductase)/FAD synthetase
MHNFPPLMTTPTIDDLITKNAPVAVGISGGKDSNVAAFEVQRYLREVGHQGPLILIHSHLGRIEHTDSLPACQRLADRLGLELVVVRRKKGDMVDRWSQRQADNLERYRNLKCVKLVLPWSTASMRFCTSELKTAIICRYLVELFKYQTILSVVGIRRQESSTRAKALVCEPQEKLDSKTYETTGYNWHPILAWELSDVLVYHDAHGFSLHEAYTRFLMSRVSCSFCILSSIADLIASATDPRNHDVYRELVDLEIVSSFSFQSGRWLGDVAPHLLSSEQQRGLAEAKRRASAREQVESRIPSHLKFTRGWPTIMISKNEAKLLSEVRRAVADIMQIEGMKYLDADAIIARYEELIAKRQRKGIVIEPARILPVQQGLWGEEIEL